MTEEAPESLAVDEYQPEGPRPIKRLSEDVVNKIAAAEIIHRPSNAIKELIENSLDAGSTSIKVTLKDGGLKLIQITDNGHGINKADLPLLCTRYATSKLTKFEDLQSIGTYGFRGEALASISYVSHVEVITKTKDGSCGWKATYMNGEMAAAKSGLPAEAKPAAANDGTIISAEDLFYNMPLRKRAFKSPSDEYNRVLDVITKYAVHNPHSAWMCKKGGSAMPDITTPVASSAKANIALLYGAPLANDLLEIPSAVLEPQDKLGARLSGWISNANSSWARKGGWILFINNRLVDSSKIKKAVDSLYTTYLPKGSSPWVYLSLAIDPSKVDVNVSPTKSEVHFLNEDEMIEAIVAAVQTALLGANTSRSFTVQTLLPGAIEPAAKRSDAAVRKAAPNYKVRMDPSNRTLASMLAVADPSQLAGYSQVGSEGERPSKRRAMTAAFHGGIDDGEGPEADDQLEGGGQGRVLWDDAPDQKGSARDIQESECELGSIWSLRREAAKRENTDVTEIISKHAFVGSVDRNLCLSLIQHSTKLFLVNHAALADEHFYQLALRQFGAFDRIRLEPPPSLLELLTLAVEDEHGIEETGLSKSGVIQKTHALLMERKDLMDEYFSLQISDEGNVQSLPLLLKGYTPYLDRLPHFLLCLAIQVNWNDEKECFSSFMRELAFFYSPRPLATETNGDLEQEEGLSEAEINHQTWQLEHVLFPSFRRYTAWPKDMLHNGDLRQVANLPDLFRIFERC